MSRLRFVRLVQMRQKSSFAVVESIDELFSTEKLKFRKHPGMMKPRSPETPPWLNKIVTSLISEQSLSVKQASKEANELMSTLVHRRVPLESDEVQQKLRIAKDKSDKLKDMNDEEFLKSRDSSKLIKQITGYWKPIEYNARNSLLYLIGRSVPDYCILYQIFSEIKNRDPSFKPYTLLDFGSGVGTVLWAATDLWKDSLVEHVCIDTSNEMNQLAERVMYRSKLKTKGVFFRQHLPKGLLTTHDIVTSAFSLLELPDLATRLQTVTHLWEKTEQYLILVEIGNRAGFQVLNEARDFILKHLNKSKRGNTSHMFSPCPHDKGCPRYLTDNTPCNFEVLSFPFPMFKARRAHQHFYSYLVFKKGARSNDEEEWPRIVRPILKRSNHVICRMCTNSGELKEEIFTKRKNGRNAYRCARSSEWGDRLPMFEQIEEETEEKKEELSETKEEIPEIKEDSEIDKDAPQKTDSER